MLSNLAATLSMGLIATIWGSFFGAVAVIWSVWGLLKRWLEGKGIIETTDGKIDKILQKLDQLVSAIDADFGEENQIKDLLMNIKSIVDHHDQLHRPVEFGTAPKAWCKNDQIEQKICELEHITQERYTDLHRQTNEILQLVSRIVILLEQTR